MKFREGNEEREMSCSNGETLVEAALRVLHTDDPFEKARLGDDIANKWLQGHIIRPYDDSVDIAVPDRPSRLSNVSIEQLHSIVI